MDATGLPKSVKRITVLSPDAAGATTARTLYEKSSDKKKQTRILRPLETAARRVADAAAVYAETYAERHRDSNRKKRDGWVRDLNNNVMKAGRKGAKRLKITRVLLP
jgi:hypothetical protein